MKNHVLIADETDLMFTQHVVHADKINKDEKQKPMRTSVAPAEQTEIPEPPKENECHTVDPEETKRNEQQENQMILTPGSTNPRLQFSYSVGRWKNLGGAIAKQRR